MENNYISITVDANAGQYYEDCRNVVKWKYSCQIFDELPKNANIVRSIHIETCGLPTWAYVFYIKA